MLLAVGRLAPEKGMDVLARAFAQVRRQSPGARLVIAGEGPERPALEALIDALGLCDAVSLAGRAANPWAMMASADLLVVPSHAEGFCMVLVEALACGCPVVSTRCGSAPADILQNGRLGRLAAAGDPQELAAAVIASLREPQPDPAAMVAGAERFALDPVIDAYAAALDAIDRSATAR